MKIFLNFTVKILKYATVEHRKYITESRLRLFLEICYGFFTIFRDKSIYDTRDIFAPPSHRYHKNKLDKKCKTNMEHFIRNSAQNSNLVISLTPQVKSKT